MILINSSYLELSYSKMDTLPTELLSFIFKHLELKKLVRLRLVSKRFKSSIDRIRIKELVVKDEYDGEKKCWFYTNDQINYENTIKLNSFLAFKMVFKFEKCVRRLIFNLFLEKHDFNFALLDHFVKLDQLKFQGKFHSNQYLSSPSLRILEIHVIGNDFSLFLNTPELSRLKSNRLKDIYLRIMILLDLFILAEYLKAMKF